MKNPKIEGSGIVECKPQVGRCSNNCNQCYYNRNKEYRDATIIPDFETRKIVRMNAGHDSNINRDSVIACAELYKHVFFNTSIANFNFPGPVVFTANPEEEEPATLVCAANLMFVRLRVSSTNLDLVNEAIQYYTSRFVPVVLTYIAYYTELPRYSHLYDWKKRNINSYYCPTESFKRDVLLEYGNRLVRNCGNLCKDCKNCETLYWWHNETK